jgi:hypothetical protein
MAPMTQGTLSYLFDEVVTSVIYDASFVGPAVMPFLFSMREMSGRRERIASFGGLDTFAEKQELASATEDSLVQQFEKTFTPVAFAKSLVISREAARDEEFGFVARLATSIGEAFLQTLESKAGDFFNDADTGAIYTGEDGLSLANNAHVNSDSANSQDNLYAVALNMANLKTVRDAGRKLTNYRGTAKSHCKFDLMLVPIDLEETAWEIVRSLGRPEVANNALNMYNGMFDLLVFDEISSTTQWGLIDQKRMKQNLFWLWRDAYESFGDGDLFKGQRRIGAYFRAAHGHVDWRWYIQGNS